ncbi:MAG: prepilin-type N-terminal cleavage/methylation domain-containing protein [Pirellulaceae bacterium]|jgi:general secretion pathway protein G|nr:prepilin-type N-terminal cleavage/methylation domain-containing protein [Pirellulaceae bacterium]MDP7020296.1 prepilin-type N-terminal cleavage/methylation domain-containing protein [Pirellulaceae bacterium]
MARAGFTLVEIVVVVLVIGIIAAMAFPSVLDWRDDAEVVAVAKHLQILADATDKFYVVNHRWPRNDFPGNLPADFQAYVHKNAFQGSPLGGQWDWNGPGSQINKIGPNIVVAGALNASQQSAFLEIDQLLDDGNLTTGSVQQITYGSHRILQFILIPSD